MSNLDLAKQYFKKASLDLTMDVYHITDRFEIQWTGYGELFVVNEVIFDLDFGYVDNPEIYSGDFKKCLDWIVRNELTEYE